MGAGASRTALALNQPGGGVAGTFAARSGADPPGVLPPTQIGGDPNVSARKGRHSPLVMSPGIPADLPLPGDGYNVHHERTKRP
jgi:hypothetical protein